MTARFEVAPIAFCLLFAGCNDPLSLADVAGTYQLGGVNAKDLPYLLTATVDCDQWIAEGQLILQQSGQFTLTVSGSWDCSRSGGVGSGFGPPLALTRVRVSCHYPRPKPNSKSGHPP